MVRVDIINKFVELWIFLKYDWMYLVAIFVIALFWNFFLWFYVSEYYRKKKNQDIVALTMGVIGIMLITVIKMVDLV